MESMEAVDIPVQEPVIHDRTAQKSASYLWPLYNEKGRAKAAF
jgi:hypothetical protein